MKKFALFLLGVSALGLVSAHAQSRHAVDFIDPAGAALIADNAKIETAYFAPALQDHFFEGPVWSKKGNYLLVSDIPGNQIVNFQDGKISPYLSNIFTGKDFDAARGGGEPSGLQYINVGPSGTTFDPQGRLVFCAIGSGEIRRQEADGKVTVLADSYQGHHLNAPNDLVVKADGAIYFTEFEGHIVSKDKDPQEGGPGPLVYLLKDGKLTILADNLKHPNGLAFTPDQKHLYVDDSSNKKIIRYDINADDTLSNATVFADMNGDKHPGNASAIKVDAQGNVWDIGPGGVWAFTPEGKHVVTLRTLRVTNLAFGGNDGKTLFMTGPGYLLKVQTKIAGIIP